MKPNLKVLAGGGFTFGAHSDSIRRGVAVQPLVGHSLHVKTTPEATTCSGGRWPQPVALDQEFARLGRCYYHGKVEKHLIVDRYEGPTFDENTGHSIPGELVRVSLP